MDLLKRDFTSHADHQACEFIGAALPPTAKLWSKAGYMSTARHDAAVIEPAEGAKFVLVIFTVNHSAEKEIIPELARMILGRVTRVIQGAGGR